VTLIFALPLVGTLAAAYLTTSVHRRLRSDIAAKLSAVALAMLLLAAVPTLWLIGSSGLAHVGFRSPLTDWSEHLLPTLGPTGALVGMFALALMIVGAVRSFCVLRLQRRLRATQPSELEILPTSAVFAYTLPGSAGNIVLSEGLVASLSERECQAVVAHERAHARHRHDRYILFGRFATALLPMTNGLCDRLEFSLERWADDEAAVDVSDRRLVATAIARVALAGSHPLPSVAGIARLGAVARAESLLAPAPRHGVASPVFALTGLALGATMISTAFQLHHSVMFAATLVS
jgi:Zn-dependent protease with chaperone function